MSRRIEIELTSERPDGTWTWRAAGAKQPKGELEGRLVPEGVAVGDVLKADADFTVDGIDILSLITAKRIRREPELLELLGSGREEPLVTTKLVERKGRDRDRDRRRRRDGDERGDSDRRGGRGERGDRGDRGQRGDRGDRGDRGQRGDRQRERTQRREWTPERPRPKRLRAGRAHRAEVLDSLPPEHQPIAEQVLRGGIPAVRDAIAKQNEQAKKENRPEIPADQLVDLAEKLLPRLRAAEWRDRADAALAEIDEIDLRDLRSVIVAADSAGRDPEAMAIRDQIQQGLTRRVEEEHAQWIDDMKSALDSGRFIRVLRLSSRPPKAGTPIPVDISSRLIATISEKVTAELSQDLWAQTLDALAFSPVRSTVTITSRPAEPSAELMEAVRRVGSRLPEIAVLFGLDPAELAEQSRRTRPQRSNRKAKAKDDAGSKAKAAPEADGPSTNDAAGAAPDTAQPDSPEPDSAERDSAEMDTTEPDSAAPDSAEMDTTEPDSAAPDSAEMDTTEPDSAAPDSAESSDTAAQSDDTATESGAAAESGEQTE